MNRKSSDTWQESPTRSLRLQTPSQRKSPYRPQFGSHSLHLLRRSKE
ncbi:Uncharacterised protein [Vibrio cholerae]|nr:Uncharacterised protein [Vibrio cholerae]